MFSRGSSSRSRGHGAYPRGISSFRGSGRGSALQQSVPEALPLPTGPVLLKVKDSELVALSSEDTTSSKITEVTHITSYNWLEKDVPTIKVPGKPPKWTPLAKPVQLLEDSGTYFRDLNAAHYPEYPMEPVVQALFMEQPDYSSTEVDIVACGSTLGNLVRFVRGNDKQFRFLIEAVGDTVFFIRKEKSSRETIPDVRGYGHSFPENYTTWEDSVKGSTSHQRVIQYRFGGLKFLVRFESDGYLRDKTTSANNGRKSEISPSTAGSSTEMNPNILSDLLDSTAVTRELPKFHTDLKIVGSKEVHVPQNALFDLKTRSARKKDIDTLAEELQRLWVAQIPNFIIAYHESGKFTDIRVMNVRDKILQWERHNQEILRQLAALVQKLVEFARSRDGETIEVRRTDLKSLELREYPMQGSAALPLGVKARWLNVKGPTQEPLPQNEIEEDDFDDMLASKAFEQYDSDDYESEESEKDFTACSAEDCGYCGHCSY